MQTLDRAVAILACLKERDKGVREVGRELEIPRSSVHRILVAMKHHGLVEQLSDTEKFCLGLKLFELGNIVGERLDLRKRALPHLTELRNLSGETVQLAVLDGKDLVYLETLESPGLVRLAFSPRGARRPATYGTLGKVLTAHQDESQIRELTALSVGHTSRFNTPEDYMQHLAQVKIQGYAIDYHEPVEGVVGIAVPVRNHTGAVAGAIAVGALSARTSVPERLQKLTAMVRKTARSISHDLGYTPTRLDTGCGKEV